MRCFAPLIMKAIRSSSGQYRLLDWEAILLKPYNSGGHSAYQERILTQLRKHYPDAASSLSASIRKIMEKFWSLDLSGLGLIMADRYSDFGPKSSFWTPPMMPCLIMNTAANMASSLSLTSMPTEEGRLYIRMTSP